MCMVRLLKNNLAMRSWHAQSLLNVQMTNELIYNHTCLILRLCNNQQQFHNGLSPKIWQNQIRMKKSNIERREYEKSGYVKYH